MAKRALKRHVQQTLHFPDKNGQRRGGKRRGAGRPKKGLRASEKHQTRERFKRGVPLHVVLRAATVIGRLRTRHIYMAVREAMITAFRRDDFHIVHLSIQANHIHMLVEATDWLALARGMQGFQISAAKHINAALSKRGATRRQGSVFPDRYYVETIASRRQARHSLAYVLNNWRRHGEHRGPLARTWKIDPFSSGDSFDGWRELEDSPVMWKTRASYKSLPVWRPTTWLLRIGWRMYGLVGAYEIPGPRASCTGRARA
jgi:REP element-mobilizing transposase RayT